MDATTTDGDEAVDRLARAGFAAKGALYAVLGLLAIRLGLGGAGGDTSQQGAISSLAAQPFGRVLVALLAVGLSGYALFRGVQVFRGGAASFSSLPDWLARVTFGVRAVIYTGLAVLAWREALGGSGGGGPGETEQSATAAVLDLPGGQWLVMAVGAIIVIVGFKQIHEGWTCGFRDHLDFGGISGGTRTRLELAGRIGHVARGVVFLVSGGFLGLAAWRLESEDGVGLDAALQEVVQAPYGPYLLTALGLGLVLYGFFCGVEARFLRPSRAD